MSFTSAFLSQARDIIDSLDHEAIDTVAQILADVRGRGGRLFVVGSGGGAGHASHAVCDFRKLCNIEAYCPTDNVSELTARVNDEGWDVSISNYLKVSRFRETDALFILSVGGGDERRGISPNLVQAVRLAGQVGANVVGIVGRDGGFTAEHADACVVIPSPDPGLVTPHTEAFQALVWHLLVSHPVLRVNDTKWESATNTAHRSVRTGDPTTSLLDIKIFADGADAEGIFELARNAMISGFTTNPTLMRKAGISDYRAFALDVLSVVRDRPFSFEVFSDDLLDMEIQAHEIASWGENVYVKIPITNTRGEKTTELIRRLSKAGIKVNVTAVMTVEQVREVVPALQAGPAGYVSVFAGRIADTGRDPIPVMKEALRLLREVPHVELIWASPRELLNLVQASKIGCHIITVTNDILKKLHLLGKDLNQFSLETVKMFYTDALAAGFSLDSPADENGIGEDMVVS